MDLPPPPSGHLFIVFKVTEKAKIGNNLAHSAHNPVIDRGVKYRCIQRAEVRMILFYGCETWSARVADELYI